MGFLDFLNKAASTASQLKKIADAPSIRLVPYCDGTEGGIMVENNGEYKASGIYAKLQVLNAKSYPCGPDPIALKFGDKVTIELAGKDKDYLKLCQIRGKKCVLQGNGAELGEGKYTFDVTVFSSNAERKEIGVRLEFTKGKLKQIGNLDGRYPVD